MIDPPAKRPCGSCPYRRDAPSGIWSREEYEKLPEYDKPTAYQPPQVFMCHRNAGCLCASVEMPGRRPDVLGGGLCSASMRGSALPNDIQNHDQSN